MSVEYDRPTSGPFPAEIACSILGSSWPEVTFTWILGYLAWKSASTSSTALASRSVNGCQNSIVPDASTGAVAAAPAFCFGAGVQAADSNTAATASAMTRGRGFIGPPLGRGECRGSAAAEQGGAHRGEGGVQRA